MAGPVFKPVADHALLVELGTQVDDAINRQIIVLDQKISGANIEGLIETVPAMVNLLRPQGRLGLSPGPRYGPTGRRSCCLSAALSVLGDSGDAPERKWGIRNERDFFRSHN